MSTSFDRRRFLRLAAVSAAAIPLSALVARTAAAADKLAATDPMAVALGYVDDASKTKDPVFKPGSHCGSCQLYTTAQEAGGFAPCSAMGGKLVASAGWCKAYTAKA